MGRLIARGNGLQGVIVHVSQVSSARGSDGRVKAGDKSQKVFHFLHFCNHLEKALQIVES